MSSIASSDSFFFPDGPKNPFFCGSASHLESLLLSEQGTRTRELGGSLGARQGMLGAVGMR